MEGLMHQSFFASDRTFYARRGWHDVLPFGHNFGQHRIERLMREQALRLRRRCRQLVNVRQHDLVTSS
jgi:putative transposase